MAWSFIAGFPNSIVGLGVHRLKTIHAEVVWIRLYVLKTLTLFEMIKVDRHMWISIGSLKLVYDKVIGEQSWIYDYAPWTESNKSSSSYRSTSKQMVACFFKVTEHMWQPFHLQNVKHQH